MNAKMKDPECVQKKVKITPPDYSKENYLATFTPQKQLTPEQIFWSQDLIKMKAEALKTQATASRPIKALMVYPPNTPATLVPRVLPTKKGRNGKIKQHYKELYDSIKITRAKHLEQTTALLTKNESLKVQIQNKLSCVNKDHVKPKVLAPGKYAIDVEPIPPRNRNNREVHLVYLKHLKESVETLHEIVEEAKVERPLDSSLASACRYTKHSQELLEYVIGTCPKDLNTRDNKHDSYTCTKKKQVMFEEQKGDRIYNKRTRPYYGILFTCNSDELTGAVLKGRSILIQQFSTSHLAGTLFILLTIDQDAPSPSHSPLSSALQSLSLHKGVAADSTLMEDNPLIMLDKSYFI
ncbi:hypothetical protein Tco_0704954 [Tanacetum coccineum]|uniref:Uncharacterized protein n=1 Tax=Tanacetum coccineum TaxID=301880 RepID=A0ABQ4Y4T1_9ASTR